MANTAALDFDVQGTVSPVADPVPDLAVSMTHTGGCTQGDTGVTYTITVTNSGTAATTGAVSVTNLLPAGLTATAIAGDGWSADLANLTCTRSNALAVCTSYPPITVTNVAIVSGGGESNTANNAASDPTTVVALTPIQAWWLQWFGTTANSGAAADTAVATSDGMPNVLKYALGLDTLVATDDPVVGNITTGYLRLTVSKHPQATDVNCHVEVAGDLTTASGTTNGTTVDVNTPTLLQVRANKPVAVSYGGFIRLRVSRP